MPTATPTATPTASPTASPTATPTATPTPVDSIIHIQEVIPEVTPSKDDLLSIFSSDVPREVQNDDDLLGMSEYHWDLYLGSNLTNAAPFLVCASHGREGVIAFLTYIDETPRLPIYSQGNTTCYIAYGSTGLFLNLTISVAEVKVVLPLSSTFKMARGMFRNIFTGLLFAQRDLCSMGWRMVMAPGFGTYKRNLNAAISSYMTDLLSGDYRTFIGQNFYWAVVGNTTSTFNLKRAARLANLRDAPVQVEPPSINPRGSKWIQALSGVLSGNQTCDFSSITLQVDMPYVTVKGLCSLYDGVDLEQAGSCALALLAYLTAQSQVMYVEAYSVISTFNWNAAWITQAAVQNSFPYYAAGLTGAGQIAQVADTGLDLDHCFFNDTRDVAVTTFSAATFDTTRRKVVQYVSWADAKATVRDHGTHVVGTVLGYRAGSTIGRGQFNGVAPMAKVAFFDIGSPDLSIPSNLADRMYTPGYKAGARVFSNSWGTASNAYTYLDVQTDQFMYDNQDALVIFAAGNSGNMGMNTAASPSLTKNGIGVGASESASLGSEWDSNLTTIRYRGC
jgi:hypothetical protein